MFEIYKVICNYLHLNAGNASGSGLPQLNVTNLLTLKTRNHVVSITVTVTLSPPSLPQPPPTPLQPNHVVCHIILWLVGVAPFSTNRKGSVTSLHACWHFLWERPILTVIFCNKHSANVTAMLAKKRGGHYLSYQSGFTYFTYAYQNWYIVWRPRLAATSS